MPRLPTRRLVPWFVVFEVLRAGKQHWDELDPKDRTRLVELMRKSKGRAANLTPDERTELRMIARRLQLVRFGRNAATAAFMGRHKRRR
jgi:hypothetical protein